MTRYSVSFVPQALDDIQNSYEWGVEFWGREAADRWLIALHDAVFKRLSQFPRSCTIAPEIDEVDGDIRQLHFLRYRIIFEVRESEVIVLRVAGPYKGVMEEFTDEQ